MNNGKQFESLTEYVFRTLSVNDKYTKILPNTKLHGPDGEKRQIDILVETHAFGFRSVTMIECKDHSRPIDTPEIEKLWGKSQDLPVDIVIMVARNGFTKGAVKKAKRKNIRLCTLDQSTNIENLGLDCRLVVVEICPTMINLSFIANEDFKTDLRKLRLNGETLFDFIKKNIESGNHKIQFDSKTISWTPENLVLSSSNDNSITTTSNMRIDVTFDTTMYIGFTSQLKETLVFENIGEETKSIIYASNELKQYRTLFESFGKDDILDVSTKNAVLVYIAVPEPNIIPSIYAEINDPDGTTKTFGDKSLRKNPPQ